MSLSTEQRAEEQRVVWPDAADEYRAFADWWKRVIQSDVPGVTSHYFGTWMESARRQVARIGGEQS